MTTKEKTTFVDSIEIMDTDVVTAYNYRKGGETLGTLTHRKSTNKWHVYDYMNEVENVFPTEAQAKTFIRKSSPILV